MQSGSGVSLGRDVVNTALIVVDMQRCMADPSRATRNNLDAEANMLSLIGHWRSLEWPVIHIRHASREPSSGFWPSQVGAQFQDAFQPSHGETVFEKQVTDAFSGTSLERHLRDKAIYSLVIVGVATNYSVEATARTAGCLGFSASVVSDACFTFDRIDLKGTMRSADEIHWASLSNLAGEYARITTSQAVFASVLRSE
jgi:nicotinamidase-related amidase